MKVLILVLIVGLVLAMNIQSDPVSSKQDAVSLHQPLKASNLKFTNFTGAGIPSSMVTGLIQIINDACTYYRFDIPANVDYIWKKIQGSYSKVLPTVLILP